nr:HPP family protein [Caulobacter sp. NIBR2454]
MTARLIAGGGDALQTPLLMAPLGASAVLVFALPASPLAQPRAVIGGNTLSAIVGVTCALFIPHQVLAAAMAVGVAILLMSLLGVLHPPGGAVALSATLAVGAAPGSLNYGYVLEPVALCSILLVMAGMIYVNLTGRTYPHRTPAPVNVHKTEDPPPSERAGYTPADLDKALAQYGELLDVSRQDLDLLFRQVELQAHRRLHSRILCGQIMSRDVVSVSADQSAQSALAVLLEHDLRTAPAIDAQGRVAGLVRRAELQAGGDGLVADLLDPAAHRVTADTPIQALLPLLSSGEAHEVMVVDYAQVLIGLVTQTDLLAVLYRTHVVEAVAAGT